MIKEEKSFGGNRVRVVDDLVPGRHVFADASYVYYLVLTGGPEDVRVDDLQSFSVFVLTKPEDVTVRVGQHGQLLGVGDALQCEEERLALTVSGAGARLLVAGTRARSGLKAGTSFTASAKIYRVAKPWGHELWVNGQHPMYALKEIAISRGTKTSLQFHRRKQETNVLFGGVSRLHFKKDPKVHNEDLTPSDIGTVDLEPVTAIDVLPPTVHRLEALSDILLYEVSTPHLDDVVRLEDDAKRPDGRLQSEHHQ